MAPAPGGAAVARPRLAAAPAPRPPLSEADRAPPAPAPRGPDPWAAHAALAGLEAGGTPLAASGFGVTAPVPPRPPGGATAEGRGGLRPPAVASARPAPPPAEPVFNDPAPAAPPPPIAAPTSVPAPPTALAPPETPAEPDPAPEAPRRGLPWSRRARPADAAAARLRALSRPAPPAEREAEEIPPETEATAAGPVPPLRPLMEGFGALVVLLLADLLLGGSGFAQWAVSPFALPVIYVAARYGLVPGVAVAVAAGLLRLGLALSNDAWTADAWAEPLAWPLAAGIIGVFADLSRHRLEATQAAAAAALLDRTAIAESNDRLAARAMELDARLGARLQAATAVFEATRALGHGTEGVIRGATGLVRAATGCTACSFWLAEDRTLHLVAAEGWPDGATLARHFLRDSLVDAMEAGRGALVVTRPADRLALAGEGILAAPVLSPWDGLLLGMVKVEDIGFADLAIDTVAALEAAAGWLGAALADARAREASDVAAAAAGGGAAGPGGGVVVPGEDAARAIAAMTGLARRVGFDLALLWAEIPAGPRAAAALEATRAAMAEAFRGSDLLLEARLDERRLSVLLPGAAVGGAEVAVARLRALLAERAPAATASVVIGVALLHGTGLPGGGRRGVHG